MKSGISTTNGCFLSQLTTALILIAGTVTANGQGTVVFSAKMGLYGTNYNEQGMGFRVATLLPENTSDWVITIQNCNQLFYALLPLQSDCLKGEYFLF